jgi:hypothetical protein
MRLFTQDLSGVIRISSQKIRRGSTTRHCSSDTEHNHASLLATLPATPRPDRVFSWHLFFLRKRAGLRWWVQRQLNYNTTLKSYM